MTQVTVLTLREATCPLCDWSQWTRDLAEVAVDPSGSLITGTCEKCGVYVDFHWTWRYIVRRERALGV